MSDDEINKLKVELETKSQYITLIEEKLRNEKIISDQLDNKNKEIAGGFSKYQNDCNIYIQQQQIDFNEKLKQFSLLGNEYGKIKKEYDDLYNAYKLIKDELNKTQSERDNFQSINKTYEIERISNEEKSTSYINQIQLLKEEKQNLITEKSNHLVLLDKLGSEKEGFIIEVTKLKKTNENLRNIVNELDKEKVVRNSELERIRLENEKIKASLYSNNKDKDIEKLKEIELEEIKNKYEKIKSNLEDSLNKSTRDISELKTLNEEKLKSIKELNESIFKKQTEIDNLNNKINTIQLQSNKELSESDKAQNQNKIMLENMSKQEAYYKNLILENDTQLKEKQTECEKLVNEINSLKNKLSSFSDSSEADKNQNKTLLENIAKHEKFTLENMSKQENYYKNILAENETKFKDKSTECEVLIKINNELKEAIENFAKLTT